MDKEGVLWINEWVLWINVRTVLWTLPRGSLLDQLFSGYCGIIEWVLWIKRGYYGLNEGVLWNVQTEGVLWIKRGSLLDKRGVTVDRGQILTR